MGETPTDRSDTQERAPDSGRSAYQEYGDTLSDVLKDQARRTELRARETPRSGRKQIHPVVPPILALLSIWLWLFPPPALIPDVPTIALANQEAGLRMGMVILVNDIKRYESENGRLPGDLQQVGDSPEGVAYVRMSSSVFQLSGQTGDIMVEYTSTEPVEALLANAMSIVSGTAPSAPEEGPSI